MEDDAHAMRLICSVIHHRNTNIPDTLTASGVLQIAVEADKYDLSVALKYARAHWLKPKGDEDLTDMAYLMVAAFLFRDMGAFVARSLDLIINYKETYLGLLDDENISQMIPLKTFYLLAERRTRFRAEISQLLFECANTGCSCGWGKSRGEKCALLQSEYQPLKMIDVPVLEIIDNMKAISTEDMGRKYHSDRQYSGYYHETPPYEKTLLGRIESMKRKAGICLDDI
ncbi:hypothetical protein BHE90_004944 [Fusarium euwallaceae]|uniref:BTB domain-containing protein n=1 Tax=Fusarium euwallaceae TaxID=1147111 RepID=A0A430LXT1_9HYPO|nr:hypothetical protein BHE90_004944 [Fusarium euwallaceae]